MASAVGLLALLLVVPAGQLRYIGWPLPDHVPSVDELRTALTSRDWLTDATLVDGLSVLLWLLWLLFVASVMVELGASIRGVRAPRYRLLAPTQGVASALVAGLTATIVATAPAPALTPSLLPPPAHPTAAATVLAADMSGPAATSRGDAASFTPVGSVTVLIGDRRVEHTVAKDETLWRIADTYLGDGRRWTEIWELNKGKYWPHVSGRTTFHDPDLIFPGWVLTLPADAAPPPAQPDNTPSAPTPPSGSTSRPPSPDPAPSNSPPPAASPTPTLTAPADGVPPAPSPTPAAPSASTPAPPKSTATATPGPPTTASPRPSAQSSSGPAHDDASVAATPGWIQLAGGFIGLGLAAGLVYAAATVWKRRRHHYKPTPITSPVLDDADLTPPLGALTHIRQSLRRQAPELLDHKPKPATTVRQYTAAHTKPPLPAVGPTGADLAGVSTLPISAGLGLTGPAALDAARALLVATLTSGHPDDPDAQGQAVVPAATLATLLGVSAVDLGPIHRLTVTASFADALTVLEEEIIRRSRIIADHEAADVAALRATDALAEPLPQLLLIADVPEDGWHTRLATAIRLGKAVEIGTTLIGDWPHGTTLTVAGDGSTTGGDGQRIAVLDTAATTQILTMLREAHGDTATATQNTATPPDSQAPAPPAPTPNPAPPSTADTTEKPHPPTQTPTAAPRPAAPTRDRVVVRVLGPPTILGTDHEPARGLRAKSLELLVYLAVHRNGASLDDIMEAIWGDATPRRAAERLSTCVGNLRGVIRSLIQPATTDDNGGSDVKKRRTIEPVVNTGGHYHLDPALLHIDLWTMLDEYAQVATSADDATRLAHLQAAIAIIGGGLADGADYEWIDTDREHVRRRIIKIYAQAAQLLADTDPHQSRAYSDVACDLDPLSDELARRAMRAAARLGDADAIRARLAALRRELDEAGVELDPDTERLAARLLRDLANP